MLGRTPLIAFCTLSSTRHPPYFPTRYLSNLQMFPSQTEAQQHVSETARSDHDNHNDSDNGGTKTTLTRCGDLACQHDSFLQKLSSAKIISYAPFEFKVQKANTKKKKSKEPAASKEDSDTIRVVDLDAKYSHSPIIYAIALTDSVFFPEGGGQPADHGTLTLKNEENEAIELHVQDAQNINEVCILFCRAPSTTLPDDLSKWLQNENLEIVQEIDWERRFDLMTQHSGQHLISAVALSEYEIQTHTFSLGDINKLNYIDFTIDESWDKEYAMGVFTQIEGKVNNHIRDNLSMTPTWLDPNDPSWTNGTHSSGGDCEWYRFQYVLRYACSNFGRVANDQILSHGTSQIDDFPSVFCGSYAIDGYYGWHV